MESMSYWQAELADKAPGTQAKYQEYFTKFCVFAKKAPDELIEQRRRDLKAEDPREQRAIECLLKAFMVKLKEQGMSPATQQIAFAAVKSFFECNEFPLHTKRSDYPKGESLGSRAITKQIIKQILEDTKHMKDALKMRALILFLKDTGLGVSDVRNLNYGHLRDGLEKNVQFIPLQMLRQKTKTTVKTFVGPEAAEALCLYLDERRKGTRRIPPETITDDSPLFRTNEKRSVERISREGLSSMIRFQCLKTGAAKLSAHSFRKYLQTSLDAAGVSPNFIDRIMGHKLMNSRDAYSQPTDEDLLKSYMNAYSHVRIYPDKIEIDEKVGNLEVEIAERNKVIADLLTNGEKKDFELQTLKESLQQLQSQVNLVTSSLALVRRKDPPPSQKEFAKSEVFKELKKQGYVTKK